MAEVHGGAHIQQGQHAELFSQQDQTLPLWWTNILWNNHRAPACWKGEGWGRRKGTLIIASVLKYWRCTVRDGWEMSGSSKPLQYSSAVINMPWWAHFLWRVNYSLIHRSTRICSDDATYMRWTLKSGKELFLAALHSNRNLFEAHPQLD